MSHCSSYDLHCYLDPDSRRRHDILRFDSWDKKKIRFEELPTMRDVLAAADLALVADALHPRHVRLAESEGEEPPAPAVLRSNVEATVGEMLSTRASTPDGDHVLIASTYVWRDLDPGDVFRACAEARLVVRADLPLYARYLEEGRTAGTSTDEVPVNGWGCALCPWEETLAYRAWVPDRMCEREVYQFVADVLWEMTLFGGDYETAEERRSRFAGELERSVAEVREAMAVGRLDEVAIPFDAAAEPSVLGIPDEEHAYMRRMDDIEGAVDATLRREFHRDCVELAGRLI